MFYIGIGGGGAAELLPLGLGLGLDPLGLESCAKVLTASRTTIEIEMKIFMAMLLFLKDAFTDAYFGDFLMFN